MEIYQVGRCTEQYVNLEVYRISRRTKEVTLLGLAKLPNIKYQRKQYSGLCIFVIPHHGRMKVPRSLV